MKFKTITTTAITLILLTTLALATSTITAPAVDSNGNGVLTTITATATLGTGKIRTDIGTALVAQDTEHSIRAAKTAAAKLLKIDSTKYDVNIDINADAQQIDGPSGGLALGLVIYSELAQQNSNLTLRKDMIVSGSINENGAIGPVGGIAEKLQAANKQKIKLALIAKSQSAVDAFDYIIYASEISNNELQVIEVKDLNEATKYAFTQDNTTIPNTPKNAITTLQLQTLQTSNKTQFFKKIAQEEVQKATKNLEEVEKKIEKDATTNKNSKVKASIRAVKTSIKTANQALEKGYYYTAANTAFLININLETILYANSSPEQLNALILETENAISQFQKQEPPITKNNFEIIATAQLRYIWAKDKISQVKTQTNENTQNTQQNAMQQYIPEIITARNWILAAIKMIKTQQAQKQNQPEENQYDIRPLALETLKQALNQNSTTPELEDHIRTARLAITEAKYIAATYDLQYALAFTQADKLLQTNKQQTNATNDRQIQNQYINSTSAWSELLYANALYNTQLAQQQNEEYAENALRLTLLAEKFSENKKQIEKDLTNPPVTQPDPNLQTQQKQQDNKKEQINAQLKITPKTNLGALQAIGITLIAITIAIIAAIAITKTIPKTDNKSKIEKIEDALINGKISEETYKRLIAKYAKNKSLKKPFKTQNI